MRLIRPIRPRTLAAVTAGLLLVASCASDDTTEPSNGTTTTAGATAGTVDATPRVIDVPAEIGGLEGIAADPDTGRLFIGDLSNGDIWVGGLEGEPFELFAAAVDSERPMALGLAVDPGEGVLYVATGAGGTLDVLDLEDGSLRRTVSIPTTSGSLVNDVTVAPDGVVYVSDSGAPRLYRSEDGEVAEVWLDYSDTDLLSVSDASLLLNGLVANDDVVLAVHTLGGQLARIDRATAELSLVELDAETAGRDGLALCGSALYGVDIPAFSEASNPEIVVTELNEDATTGTVGPPLTDPSLSFPATLAPLDGSIVVTNAQFGVQPPLLPFELTVFAAPCPDNS